MDCTLLSWNIRGINNLMALRGVRELTGKNKVNILCLQETKCVSGDKVIRNGIWVVDSHGWIIQNSEGLSGGMLVSWLYTNFSCKSFA